MNTDAPRVRTTNAQDVSLPDVLNRYLSASSRGDLPGVALYVEHGAKLVMVPAILALQRLSEPLQQKIATIEGSGRLRRSLELLSLYFAEASSDGQSGSAAHRDATFALLYFLEGLDRIPDSIPEVGLLDDAMIVELVVQRNLTAYRTHWMLRRRGWPADL
jgi:uncharacterized membrane protein YkvA (DUF1232 family)